MVSAKNWSRENVGDSPHHSDNWWKFVNAALGPIENLDIVTNQAIEPPIVRSVVITTLCTGPNKELLAVVESKARPTSNKNKGRIYLGVIWESFTSGLIPLT